MSTCCPRWPSGEVVWGRALPLCFPLKHLSVIHVHRPGAWWFVICLTGMEIQPRETGKERKSHLSATEVTCFLWLTSLQAHLDSHAPSFLCLQSQVTEHPWDSPMLLLPIIIRNKSDTVIWEHRLWMRESSGFAFLGSFKFIYLCLCWVFAAGCGISLVAPSKGLL